MVTSVEMCVGLYHKIRNISLKYVLTKLRNVYLKMKKWEEAEKDCDDALKIKPKFAKVGNLSIFSDL